MYQSTKPAPQTLVITNNGGYPFTWTCSSPSPWLTLAPTSGAIAAGGFMLLSNTVSLTGLDAGNYAATVTVSSADATNAPQSYAVSLVVAPSPQTITFPALPGPVRQSARIGLVATASSGLPVAYSVASGPGVLDGTNLSFNGTGTVAVVASQNGNANVEAATPVTNLVDVIQFTFYVNASQPDDSGDGRSWATAKRTIQAAVNLALPGERVLVTNGVYDAGGSPAPDAWVTNRVMITNAITLASVNGPEVTTIRGIGSRYNGESKTMHYLRGVYMVEGASLVGFRIEHCGNFKAGAAGIFPPVPTNDMHGGGIFMAGYASVSDCVVVSNTAYGFGGGIYMPAGGIVSDTVVAKNLGGFPGAGGIGAFKPSTITGCRIEQNLAYDLTQATWGWTGIPTIGGPGGGLLLTGGGTISNCVFSGNTSYQEGGGAYVVDAVISSCSFSNNTAESGGGIYARRSRIDNSLMLGNKATYFAGAGLSESVMVHSHIIENWTTKDYSKGGGVGMEADSLLSHSIVEGNSSVQGAGVYMYWNSRLENCFVAGNKASSIGGGVYLAAGIEARMLRSKFNYGGPEDCFIQSCTIVSNATVKGGGIRGFSRTSISNSIVWGNTALDSRQAATADMLLPSDAQLSHVCSPLAPHGVNGCTTNDPLFVDAALGNYTLQAASPCRNTGTNYVLDAESQYDLSGLPRICEGVIDMGVYEFSSAVILGADGRELVDNGPANAHDGTEVWARIGRVVTNVFAISNTTPSTLVISNVALTGSVAFAFDPPLVTPVEIAPGATTNFGVAFTGAELPPVTAQVNISSSFSGKPFLINLQGACFQLSADAGPFAGGNRVRVDVVFTAQTARVGGRAAEIVGSGTNAVLLLMPAAATPGAADIELMSDESAPVMLKSVYTYHPAPVILSVTPGSGSPDGGQAVTITGIELGQDGDITNVTLGGVSAAIQPGQSATQVVVVSGTAGMDGSGLGAVRVFSASRGEATLPDAYRYTGPAINIFGQGQRIPNGAAPLVACGTLFNPTPTGRTARATFTIANSGTDTLNIHSVGIENPSGVFSVGGLPASVPPGGSETLSVLYRPAAPGDHFAEVAISNNAPGGVFTLKLAGTGYALNPARGPITGGGWVELENGAFGIVTNVLVGTNIVDMFTQGTNSVVFVLPRSATAGLTNITVQMEDMPEKHFANAFTYYLAGTLFSSQPASGSRAGGYTVTLRGQWLGNGRDISKVSFGGVEARGTNILSQSTGQVVARVPAVPFAGPVNVSVYSPTYGWTVASNLFTFTATYGFTIRGVNRQPVASWTTPDAALGTAFSPALKFGTPRTNRFSIVNNGDGPLQIYSALWDGGSSPYLSHSLTPRTIGASQTSTFNVVYSPVKAGLHESTLIISNNHERAFLMKLEGSSYSISPALQSVHGNYAVTLSNGLISRAHYNRMHVWVGKTECEVQAYGPTWVRFTAPPYLLERTNSIRVQSWYESWAGRIETVFTNVYVVTSTVWYVNAARPNNNGNGATWGTAKRTIQAAVDIARPGDAIYVASGIYQEGSRNGNRLDLNKAVSVVSTGGYTEIRGSSTLRGVRIHPGATLSGFIIGGKATEGGGVYFNGSGTLSSCLITESEATRGGGAYFHLGGRMENCTVDWSTAIKGGCVYMHKGGILSNCYVSRGNQKKSPWRAYYGGGVYMHMGGTLSDGTALYNNAADYGGGLYQYNGGTVTDCSFVENEATYGAGAYVQSPGTFARNLLENNNSYHGKGGGLYLNAGVASHCVISGNYARVSGGGVYGSSISTLRNSLLVRNTSLKGVGGAEGSRLLNCTIVNGGSRAKVTGGAYSKYIVNSIVWGNKQELYISEKTNDLSGPSGRTVANTCASKVPSGSGNITSDPRFVNSGDDFRLQVTSPCRNKGANAYVNWGTDIDGATRIQESIVDMGAYEYAAARSGTGILPVSDINSNDTGQSPIPRTAPGTGTIYYVDAAMADDLGDGLSWETAKATIQAAVDLAADGDLVLVSNGVYSVGERVADENFNLPSRVCVTNAVLVRSVNGPDFTIIEGYPVLGSNAVRGVWLENGAALHGFTVTMGATFDDDGWERFDLSGGGIWMTEGCEVSNCVVMANRAVSGAGVFLFEGGSLLDSRVSGNNAEQNGGGVQVLQDGLVDGGSIHGNFVSAGAGVYLEGGGIVSGLAISNNLASFGGGLYLDMGGAVSQCVVSANSSTRNGGGAWIAGEATLVNSLLMANSADEGGGVFAGMGGSLLGCTIIANSADTGGGAFLGAGAEVHNSLFDGNSAIQYGKDIYLDDEDVTITHTRASDGVEHGVNGCITAPAALGENYTITHASPCRNAGDNDFAPGEFDLNGNPRIRENIVDMGAFEYAPQPSLLRILGTNGAEITNGASASAASGTYFWGPGGTPASVSNTLAITNSGAAPLHISGATTQGTCFVMSGVPATVEPGGVSNFTLVLSIPNPGIHEATALLPNDSTNSPFRLNLRVIGYSVTPSSGPLAGGNTVTISNATDATVTNVVVDIIDVVDFVDNGVNGVSMVIPPATNPGPVNITLQTDGSGDIILPNAYTYHPAGVIASVTPSSAPWFGGFPVTISGTDLADPSEIIALTLCDVPATIQSVSATQIVALAGQAPAAALGDVRIVSLALGETIASNAFAYTREAQTLFFPNPGNQPFNATPTLSYLGGLSTSPVVLTVVSGPATLNGATLSFSALGQVVLTASQAGDDLHEPAPTLTNVFQVLPTPPQLGQPSVILLTRTNALLGGTILGTGGAAVTQRGFTWSLTNNFAPGSGSMRAQSGMFNPGSYAFWLEDIVPGKRHYFRAFAVNEAGTNFSDQAHFHILQKSPPVVPLLLLLGEQ